MRFQELLQGGASTASGFPAVGDWRWFPPLQTERKVSCEGYGGFPRCSNCRTDEHR